jgi:hypothetical protein
MYICVYVLVHTTCVSHIYSLLEGHILHICHIYIASIATYYICVTYIATYYICVTYTKPIRGAMYIYMCILVPGHIYSLLVRGYVLHHGVYSSIVLGCVRTSAQRPV